DCIGNLISRMFEVMQIVMENGANKERIEFTLRSLENERQLMMEHDNKLEDPLRDLTYSFGVGLTSSIQSIIDAKKQQADKPLEDD
ncbi:hypothetical protein PFISCL1PPCAC_11099, partial [Pristionchus fissidentatus]